MSSGRASISTEDLWWLNQELHALARAGIPLEQGLRAVQTDMTGPVGRFAELLAGRLERGERLSEVLRDPQLGLPPVYAAVVAAGLRSGRLTGALENCSRSLTLAVDLRRTLVLAISYPLVVFLLATSLLHFAWVALFPIFWQLIPDLLGSQPPWWFNAVAWSVEHHEWCLLVLWALVALGTGWLFGWFRWLGIRQRSLLERVMKAGRTAAFADNLALLLEQHVPLDESLELAGAASGDTEIRTAADALASQVRSGGGSNEHIQHPLPALMSWLLVSHRPGPMLVTCLRQTARMQRDKANDLGRWLGSTLPFLLSLFVGAVLAAYYATLVLIPYFYLLWGLA